MTNIYITISHIFRKMQWPVAAVALLCMSAPHTAALPIARYATESRLSTGSWVKIAVDASGMHNIPESTLRSWGFSNPQNVKVFGYGAQRLPEVLDNSYADDLPQTPSEWVDGKGLFFYAMGPTAWTEQSQGYYHPVQNPFTMQGFYFLSETDGEERLSPQKSGTPASSPAEDCTSTFYDRLHHEIDQFSPGEAGFMLLGEDFKYNQTQTFSFAMPDIDTAQPVRVEVSFVCKASERATLEILLNGTNSGSETIPEVSKADKYSHGKELVTRRSFDVTNAKLSVGLILKTTSTVTTANLNYISVNYPRQLRLPDSKNLTFYIDGNKAMRPVLLAGATGSTRIWDVTLPEAVNVMDASVTSSGAAWTSSYTTRVTRTYAAWNPEGTFPRPTLVERVKNQNLHSLLPPDMVIFTPGEWKGQAERLAEFHRTNPQEQLDVLVLTPQQVYNEFASGSPDAQAFRKLLKMMYDKGNAGEGKKLRYALFFSRPTFDNRRLTSQVKALRYPMMATWCTDNGLHDNTSYQSDDIFGFLEDNSGANTSRDKLSIAVGRIPATSEKEAMAAVDKIVSYTNKMPHGTWRNTIVVTADDGDSAEHMKQAEDMCTNLLASGKNGADIFLKKVYIDAFELIGGKYPEARTKFYQALDDGAMWWTYIGHANPSSLTAEGLVTYQDLNNMYIRHWPVLYAATCDFVRWDSSVVSGAELLFNTPGGGVIACISATRPVYISENGILSRAVGSNMLVRTPDGRMPTLGEIYRTSKNALNSNDNKLRYVLLGDPAMRTVMPEQRIKLHEAGGKPIVPIDGDEEPAQLMAQQQTTVKGSVTDADGNLLGNFNGTVTATLYDAEYSVLTLGHSDSNGKDGKEFPFQQQGERLLIGTDSIHNGLFSINIAMPAEVADNYSPAAFNLYAYDNNGTEATGVCRDIYVYGVDENALPDTEPPVIESIYLNHPTFRDGQEINSDPMLLATVTDDRAINLSSAGIGHRMTITLDGGAKVFTDVANYFTPFTDGTPGGTIAYPIESLVPGEHTLRLRVWDTGPNSSEAHVRFSVVKNLPPVLYDVYTDANPASTAANFYITHDRPDRNVTVTVEVFNLMGRRLWTATQTGRSEMFTTTPLTWDLLDEGGRRVPRGIYIYRATISDKDSGEETSTASRKLAVSEM